LSDDVYTVAIDIAPVGAFLITLKNRCRVHGGLNDIYESTGVLCEAAQPSFRVSCVRSPRILQNNVAACRFWAVLERKMEWVF
jgi:hypothetical protein